MSSGCGMSRFDVILQPVSSTPITPDRKLAGSVAVDLTDLGMTKRTVIGDTLFSWGTGFNMDCHGALSRSIVSFANQYFENVRELGSKNDIEYDFLLRVKLLRMRMGGYFSANFEMKMSADLYRRDGSILEEVIVTGCGQGRNAIPSDMDRRYAMHNQDEWMVPFGRKIAEEAMKDALLKAFGQLTTSPEVRRHAEQIKIKKFRNRIEQF